MSFRVERLAPGLGITVWAASVWSLGLGMWCWTGSDRLARYHGMGLAGMHGRRLYAMGVAGVVGFAVLQVLALLLLTWAMRVAFRMRAETSYAVSGAAMMVADGAGLIGLLVWMRVWVGVN